MNSEDTIRERILAEWARRLVEMAPPDYGIIWKVVQREPLERKAKLYGPSVALLDLGQSVIYGVGYVEPTLLVGVDFWLPYGYLQRNTSQSLNEALGDLQRLFMADNFTVEDTTGDQLSVVVRLGTDEFDMDGPRDNFVSGFLNIQITYRHGSTDPRVLI